MTCYMQPGTDIQMFPKYMLQRALTCLFIQGDVHAESEHALYPVSIGLGVNQLVS